MERVKASGLDFPESSRLKKHLAATNDWLNKAKAALAGSIPIRELDKLLTEADRLAVDPGPRLSELRAKMEKAHVWLDKVRKAVPKQRSTRRNAPDAEAEKVRAQRSCRRVVDENMRATTAKAFLFFVQKDQIPPKNTW